jgi:outer membrane lipoprotein SlyB
MNYMKRLLFNVALVVSAMFILAGCANKALPEYRAGSISQSYGGTIQFIENTQIQGSGELSSIGGMMAGGVLGNQVGGGSGKTMSTIAGGMVGAILGKRADVRAAKRVGIKLDSGRDITTVLPVTTHNPMNFSNGSRVIVYITGGRVTEIR